MFLRIGVILSGVLTLNGMIAQCALADPPEAALPSLQSERSVGDIPNPPSIANLPPARTSGEASAPAGHDSAPSTTQATTQTTAPADRATPPKVGGAAGLRIPPSQSSLTERTLSGLTFGGLFLLLLAGGWSRYAKKAGLTNRDNQIQLIARRGISAKTALIVVKVDGRKFLLSQGTEQIALLSELDEAAIPYGLVEEQLAEEEARRSVQEQLESLRRIHG